MKKKVVGGVAAILAVMVFICVNLNVNSCIKNKKVKNSALEENYLYNENFRKLELNKSIIGNVTAVSEKYEVPANELLTCALILAGLDFKKVNAVINDIMSTKEAYGAYREKLKSVNGDKVTRLENIMGGLMYDIRYFPLPASNGETESEYSYSDSWMSDRNYGGERKHEGCDIMTTASPRGTYPIISMCDGVIENMGWLELGGYRIGVRSEHGLYIYYAHLYSYAPDIKSGDTVKKGQLLGYAGDTGYSKVEGTYGNFKVHLHLGIYINDEAGNEIALNPYNILKLYENERLIYNY